MTQLTVAEILADARKQIDNHKREVHAAAVKFGGPLIAWKDMPFVRKGNSNGGRSWLSISKRGYFAARKHGRNMALAFLSMAPHVGGRQESMAARVDQIIHDQCRVAGNSFNAINSNHIAIFEFWRTIIRFAEVGASQQLIDHWREQSDKIDDAMEAQAEEDQKEIDAEVKGAKSEATKRGARIKRARKAVRK